MIEIIRDVFIKKKKNKKSYLYHLGTNVLMIHTCGFRFMCEDTKGIYMYMYLIPFEYKKTLN